MKKKKGTGKSRKRRTRSLRWRFVLFLFTLSVFALLIASIYLLILYLEITSKFEGRIWEYPSKIYSEAQIIYKGQDMPQSFLAGKMKRMGYGKIDSAPQHQGQFRINGKTMEIYLRDFDYPLEKVKGRKVKINFSGDRIADLLEVSPSKEIELLEIEPEILATFYGTMQEERTVVKLEDFPDHLLKAVICAEDFRFFQHHGVDYLGIVRALMQNIRHGRVVEGGSTITQQLVKNLYLTEERTLARKVKEAVMALILEARYPKERIIQVYMNEIYLGQRGPISICGFGEASRFYFGKNVRDLDLSESALLAAMIPSPGSYNPHTHYRESVERRNRLLAQMLDRKMITKEERDRAVSYAPVLARSSEAFRQAPYFVDFLKSQLLELYTEEILQREGLKIFTTLDPFLQSCAERTVERGLSLLERERPHLIRKGKKLEACLVSVQPQTGNILAMVGGRDYQKSQFNRVTQAKRQPGSLFKPFVYLTGFIASQQSKDARFTAVTILQDEPYEITSGGKLWKPENYDNDFRGEVTARKALEDSINVPTVRMSEMVGLKNIVTTVRQCGIQSQMRLFPSLSLGSEEVTPLEIAEAYSVIANLGKKATPISIKDVVNLDGKAIEKRRIEIKQVISPQACYLITDILKGAVTRGTARFLIDCGFHSIAAGKTGTTNDYRDSWFMGYTPQILTLTWIGYDDNESTGLSGSSGAMRLWAEYMKSVGENYAIGDFVVPRGIITVSLDANNLQKATEKCPEVISEIFIEGTEPQESCTDHTIGIKNWFKKLFSHKVDRHE